MKRYQHLAQLVQARLNCEEMNNVEWFDKHTDTIEKEVKDTAPSGSGIDDGTRIDLDASTGEKLVFHISYHHMDESGMYDGWTDHKLTIRPSLQSGFTQHLSGPDRNHKEYLHDTYHQWLNEECCEPTTARP